jgi:hypothetical protein
VTLGVLRWAENGLSSAAFNEEVPVTIDSSNVGPVEILAVAFPGSEFKGEILPELGALVDNGTIRVLDFVFVNKDTDGTVRVMELSDLGDEDRAIFARLDSADESLLNDEDLEDAGEILAPGDSAAILVWEDCWATNLRNAIRNAGGKLLALDRVPQEALDDVLQAIADR